MITVLRARVEGGVLRPLQDIHVTDGQEVEILLCSPAGQRSARLQAWLDFLRDTEPLSEQQIQLLEQAAQRQPLFQDKPIR